MGKRRRFTAEFKREAVGLTAQPDVSVAQVARDLGIGANLLSRWRRELHAEGATALRRQGVALEFADVSAGLVGVTNNGSVHMFQLTPDTGFLNRDLATIAEPVREAQASRKTVDTAEAVALALRALSGRIGASGEDFETHCFQDVQTGAMITLIPRGSSLYMKEYLGGRLFGVSNNGSVVEIASF